MAAIVKVSEVKIKTTKETVHVKCKQEEIKGVPFVI